MIYQLAEKVFAPNNIFFSVQYGAVHSVYLKVEFALLARISGTVWSHLNYRDSHITIKSRSNILHCVSRGAHSLAIMSPSLCFKRRTFTSDQVKGTARSRNRAFEYKEYFPRPRIFPGVPTVVIVPVTRL